MPCQYCSGLNEHSTYRCYFAGDKLTLRNIRRNFSKFVEAYFAGALVEEFQEKNGKVRAVIDLANAKVNVVVDSYGAKLYKPPEREVLVVGENDFEKLSGLSTSSGTGSSLALTWYKFGLVDSNFKPTMRGRIFSFFNGFVPFSDIPRELCQFARSLQAFKISLA